MRNRMVLAFAILISWTLVAMGVASAQVSNGRATTSAPSYTNNSTAPLSLDTSGNLRVNCVTGCGGGGGGGGTSSNFGDAYPSAGTAAGFIDPGGDMAGANVDANGDLQTVITNSSPIDVDVTATVGLTDTELRASPIDVDVTATVGLTDTELRASPIDVDVTATVGLTDTELRASPVPVTGAGSTGSAPPATANYVGARATGGNLTGLITCNQSVAINTATSGSTQLVALQSSQTIYVCGYNFIAAGDVNVTLNYGTGTACGSGTTALTGAYPLAAQAGIVVQSPFWTGMASAASNALCVNLSASIGVRGVLFYTQF